MMDTAKLTKTIEDIERKHINRIYSIMMEGDYSAQEIKRTDDGKFISAVFKVEKYQLPDDRFDYVEYGMYISENLVIKKVRHYVKDNGTAVEYQPTYNHHKITKYMLEEGFKVF